jgi:hypothetical protein
MGLTAHEVVGGIELLEPDKSSYALSAYPGKDSYSHIRHDIARARTYCEATE